MGRAVERGMLIQSEVHERTAKDEKLSMRNKLFYFKGILNEVYLRVKDVVNLL